jgi:hypothetical protein
MKINELIGVLTRVFQRKGIRPAIYILSGIFLLVLTLEFWLNFQIRTSLRRNLTEGAGPDVRIEAKVSWMNISDLMNGRVKQVWVRGRNCVMNGLSFEELLIDNHGFSFDLPQLLKEKKLNLLSVNQTRINAAINEKGFQEYFDLRYPAFEPGVKVFPGSLRLTGKAQLFGNTVSLGVEGVLMISSPKSLRFYPKRLLVGERAVPREFMKFVSDQIPLEFTLMEDWPLKITGLALKQSSIQISFQEITPQKR